MTYKEAFTLGYKYAYESTANIRNNLLCKQRNNTQNKMMKQDQIEENENDKLKDDNDRRKDFFRYKPKRVQAINKASGGVQQLNNSGAGASI